MGQNWTEKPTATGSRLRENQHYNLARSHQGYRLKGRTPAQALREALGLAELPSLAFRNDEPTTEEDLPAIETAD